MMERVEYYQSVYDDTISYAVDEKTVKIAIEMLRMGLSKEQISQATELEIEKISEIESELQIAGAKRG